MAKKENFHPYMIGTEHGRLSFGQIRKANEISACMLQSGPDGGRHFITLDETGNKEDVAVSERLLNLITSKIYSDKNWSYNIAIAYYLIGQQNEAADILSTIIRKYPYEFQSYITLEAIFRNSGNDTDADKVLERMETAEERLNKKKQRSSSND